CTWRNPRLQRFPLPVARRGFVARATALRRGRPGGLVRVRTRRKPRSTLRLTALPCSMLGVTAERAEPPPPKFPGDDEPSLRALPGRVAAPVPVEGNQGRERVGVGRHHAAARCCW